MSLINDWMGSKRIKDPVRGQAHVVAISQPPDNASSFNVQMNLAVQVDGIPAYSTVYNCIVSSKKYPSPGTVLPVTVDRGNPEHLRIEWDDVEDGNVSAARSAAALAEQLNARGGAGSSPVANVSPGVNIVDGGAQVLNVPPGSDPAAYIQAMLPGAQGEQAAQAIRAALAWQTSMGSGAGGADAPAIFGGMAAGVPGMAPGAQPAAEPDPVAQIEKLAKLRESGVLSTEEFESAKRKLLGEI